MLIRARDSVLLVIDIQERLVPAMQAHACMLQNASLLLKAARACNVPTIVTEQYPQGLGRTVPEIASLTNDCPVFEKMYFSCMQDSAFRKSFVKLDRKQAVLVGVEAHVCVLQTAESLVESGYDVFVVSDATASRTGESKAACITRLNASGASIVTSEMVVFEWLGKAGTPAFKELLPLIKN
ncbi:MAG: hydrolase [Granulosicoccus sp.]